MFWPKGDTFASLKAKASETRHLVPVLKLVCTSLSTGSPRDTHCILAYEHMDHMLRLLETGGIVLSDAEAGALLHSCEAFLRHYNWLARAAMARQVRRYNVTIKHHILWHIISFARYQNPTAAWAYRFEDFMQKIVLSGKACVAGTPMELVPDKVMANYLQVLFLRLHREQG
jgi:hypothetical protein